MRPPGRESRPQADLKAAESFRGDNLSVSREAPAVVDGAPAVVVFDAARCRSENIGRQLVTASRAEREAYFAGREDGFCEGFQRGYRACDDEISRLQVAASRVVKAMVKLPERNRRDEEWLGLEAGGNA